MLSLYQFNSCPFCWKVRSLLNYANHPYETVEMNPMGMKGLEFTDHKKVPVLKDNDKVIVESATIVDYINDNYSHAPKGAESKTWTDWVDQTLVHYLPALIHPNFMTSWHNFGEIMKIEKYPWYKAIFIRLGGSVVMPKVSKRLKNKHSIEDAETEFLNAIDHWVNNGLSGKAFYGGDKPDFVDCSVFGVLRSGDKLGVVKTAKKSNTDFATWYDRCYPIMSKQG